MKTKPLTSVEEVADKFILNGADLNKLENLLTQRDNQAYTSLVEGIEGMRLEEYHSCAAPPCMDIAYPCEHITEWEVRNKTLTDILENVVKPLYNKE